MSMALNEFMTLAEFREGFPEFCDVRDGQVKHHLERSTSRLDTSVLGAKLNQAHGLLTAHTLAASPFGQQARLVSEKGDTTYRRQLKELLSETVLGVAIAGGADATFSSP